MITFVVVLLDDAKKFVVVFFEGVKSEKKLVVVFYDGVIKFILVCFDGVKLFCDCPISISVSKPFLEETSSIMIYLLCLSDLIIFNNINI